MHRVIGKNEPSFDGLRGIAVVVVILSHLSKKIFPGGGIGVDVFFVLSGFLITGLLLDEFSKTGVISLKHFYLRRAARLMPCFLVMTLIFGCIYIALPSNDSVGERVIQLTIVLTYLSNWARAFDWHDPQLFGHTWSLAVEEQFYLLWPAFVFIVVKISDRPARVVFIAAISVAAASFLDKIFMASGGASISRLYNGLDTRADSLMIGCAAAAYVALEGAQRIEAWNQRTCSLIAWGFLSALLVGLFAAPIEERFFYCGGLLVYELATIAMALMLFYGRASIWRHRLSWGALVWLGRISYGLYLWHHPMFWLARNLESKALLLAAVPASVSIAAISYYFLEAPILKDVRGRLRGATKPAGLVGQT